MNQPVIPTDYGRDAFGENPAAYHAARPDYPEWVFETLRDRCGLTTGTKVFEIGPGTGKATRRLLDLGANPLIAVEPDPRMARFLRENCQDQALHVEHSTFEEMALDESSFDLGVCATAFHWLDEPTALNKIARVLRPGGWWAALWNVFDDDSQPDLYHEATKHLFKGPVSPSIGDGKVAFALDSRARINALKQTGAFDTPHFETSKWSIELDTKQAMALFRTYSNITILQERETLLNELERIAREQFNGRVIRNMTTCLYTVRRR